MLGSLSAVSWALILYFVSSVATSLLIYETGLMFLDKKLPSAALNRFSGVMAFSCSIILNPLMWVMFCIMINWCHGVRLELTWLQKETTCNLMHYWYCAYWFATKRKCFHIQGIVWVCFGVKCCLCDILIFTTEKVIYQNYSWMLDAECIDNRTE